MDGLLIDSEPYWRKAHVRVLARHGFTITEGDVHKMAGVNTAELVSHWQRLFNWDKTVNEQIADEITSDVSRQIKETGTALPGVYDLLCELESLSIPLAVASSSPMDLVKTALKKLNIFDTFTIIHSGVLEKHNKPFPDVYLATAKQLGVAPRDCLVLEDSSGGVQAAKAADMKCVAVPEVPYDKNKFAIADLIVDSLEKVTFEQLRSL